MGDDGMCEIVSVSLGSMREFQIKKKYEDESTASPVPLRNGDVLAMCGKMQLYYDHAVAPGTSDGGGRINLTFRFIKCHTKKSRTQL